jgi:hypothetical protein
MREKLGNKEAQNPSKYRVKRTQKERKKEAQTNDDAGVAEQLATSRPAYFAQFYTDFPEKCCN